MSGSERQATYETTKLNLSPTRPGVMLTYLNNVVGSRNGRSILAMVGPFS